MAEIEPLILQNGSFNGDELRRIFTAMLAAEDFTTTDDGGGVITAGALKVTQNGTPNMSVNVAAGLAIIRGTESTQQGYYIAGNDATVNKSIAAADATNPRRDIVYLRVRDSVYSGSDDDGPIGVATGTPAASPSDPAIPSNAVALARVTVAALDTAINSGDITDQRVASRLWTRGRGRIDVKTVTSLDQTITGGAGVDLTGLSITATLVSGRYYRATLEIAHYDAAGACTADFRIIDGSATVYNAGIFRNVVTNAVKRNLTATDITGSGSTTVKARGISVLATGTQKAYADTTYRAQLVLEDIGGYLV